MTHLRMTAHFDAPIDQVFELGTDFKRYPDWNVSYNEVSEVTGPVDRIGTRIHATMKLLGRKSDGWGEIVEVDPPRLLKFRGTSSDGSTLEVAYRATPAASGTDFEAVVEYELAPGFLRGLADKLFIERAVERNFRHSLENFKALVEAPAPVPA